MKLTVLLPLFGLIIVSCNNARYFDNPHVANTPNSVAVNDTLLCDQTEVSNFSWMEYRYWLKKVFGEESPQYLASAPDSTIWDSLNCIITLKDHYHTHPAYRHYPVVGISQQQARDYSKWRSDRVFEYYLIKEGIIERNNFQSAFNYFSIENYFNERYYHQQSDTIPALQEQKPIEPDMSLYYPKFRLPDDSMRLAILNYVDLSDYNFHQKKAKRYQEWRESNLPFVLAVDECDGEVMRQTDYSELDKRNRYLLIYESRGNAAEWGDTEHLTYGGGWPHNVEYVMSKDTISSRTPNAWTGFRNVCTWKKWGSEE